MDTASLQRIVPAEEAQEAKRRALEETISQLEREIEITDPEMYPNRLSRLKAELDLTRSELD